jgi:hypothetical protein
MKQGQTRNGSSAGLRTTGCTNRFTYTSCNADTLAHSSPDASVLSNYTSIRSLKANRTALPPQSKSKL